MDGVHDLGGKIGYGPVDVNEPEEPYHYDYEGRMWAISRIARAPGITIDWWRHVRELIDPDDYLNRPYFDSWAQTHIATMIDAGVFTFAELESGTSVTPPAKQAKGADYQDVLDFNTNFAFRFDRPAEDMPKFQVGQTVHTQAIGHSGHTRLPEYARGKPGIIHSHHGAHIFPDDSAKGHEAPQHLYTVSFKSADLWTEAEYPDDRVLIDLWESYLAPI